MWRWDGIGEDSTWPRAERGGGRAQSSLWRQQFQPGCSTDSLLGGGKPGAYRIQVLANQSDVQLNRIILGSQRSLASGHLGNPVEVSQRPSRWRSNTGCNGFTWENWSFLPPFGLSEGLRHSEPDCCYTGAANSRNRRIIGSPSSRAPGSISAQSAILVMPPLVIPLELSAYTVLVDPSIVCTRLNPKYQISFLSAFFLCYLHEY